MAYTFSPKTALTSGASYYASFHNDGQHQPMVVASGIQTQDATGTPVVSPQAFPSNSVTTINVPSNAYRFHLIPLANTINISEKDSTVATNYLTAPTGVELVLPCTRQAVFYLKANSGAATGSTFFFDVL